MVRGQLRLVGVEVRAGWGVRMGSLCLHRRARGTDLDSCYRSRQILKPVGPSSLASAKVGRGGERAGSLCTSFGKFFMLGNVCLELPK